MMTELFEETYLILLCCMISGRIPLAIAQKISKYVNAVKVDDSDFPNTILQKYNKPYRPEKRSSTPCTM